MITGLIVQQDVGLEHVSTHGLIERLIALRIPVGLIGSHCDAKHWKGIHARLPSLVEAVVGWVMVLT